MDMLKNGEKPLIVLFDSGIGGLNLLKACTRIMPQADFCYFADNYRVPYGNLDEDTIKNYSCKAFEQIANMNPAAAAVACNTVTACCIDYLRQKYSFPIAGVQPAIKQASSLGGKFLVLATCATIQSAAFKNLALRFGGNAQIVACGNLAAQIEENIFNLESFAFENYIPEGKFSSVVLGCTHYAFIGKKLKEFYGCPVYDGIEGTAVHLRKISGIDDHRAPNVPKIIFRGGDYAKNEAVFRHMCR